MKKLLTYLGCTIGIILIIILMLYLTKPDTEAINAQILEKPQTKPEMAKKPTKSISKAKIKALVTAEKCDSKELNKALDNLKTQRDKEIKNFAEQHDDKAKLRQLVITQLKDHALANQIFTINPKNDIQIKRQELLEGETGRKLIEELMMASLAGQTQDYMDKFLAGDLSPLNPAKKGHKEILINMMTMGGEAEVLTAIEKLYTDSSPIPVNLLPAVINSVKKNNKALENILQRVGDINQAAEQGFGLFSSYQRNRPIEIAIGQKNYLAAELLLQLGAKPAAQNQPGTRALDYIYEVKEVPAGLISRMLDKGFTNSNSSKAKRLANEFATINPELASKFRASYQQLKDQENQLLMQMPIVLQNLIQDYRSEHQQLNQKYIQCLAEESKARPKIPEYQPINKKQIEAEIDQLVAQKVKYEQIIATLAVQNKETVEHGYQYLRQLRLKNNKRNINSLADMPAEFKTLIRLYKDNQWDQMVEFMANNQFDPAYEISPGSMLPEMIEKGAPESAIAAMAKISDKNDIKLLRRAQFQPKLLNRIAGYGFNLDATDESNKNLFYQAVKHNQVEQIDTLIGYGVSMVSDPYGYDPLDLLLRNPSPNEKLLSKLAEVGFPLTAQHQDYALYLKSYYPQRHQKLITAMPNLQLEGEWQPKN